MEVKFANPPLELGLKYHDLSHLTELKEKCSRIFKVQYSKPIRKKGNKNNRKGKQRKLGQKDWKLTAKELLKPLHLCKSGKMLQSLLVHYLFIMKEQVGSLKHKGHISNMPLNTNESQDIIKQYLRFNLNENHNDDESDCINGDDINDDDQDVHTSIDGDAEDSD